MQRDEPNNSHQVGSRSYNVPKFTWEELLHSAKGCYCCSIIISGCRGIFDLRDVKEADIVYGNLQSQYPRCVEDADEADCTKHIFFNLNNGQRFEVELFCTEDDDCPMPDAWDYFPTLQRTSPATDSQEALEIISNWIADCIEEDDLCGAPEAPELPKRVIDVGLGDGVVRLIETNGGREKYISLSHCWGLEQIITTTKSTLQDHQKAINWDELSKTFQDAITLTRILGFKYIWIDSLCIIQDSAEDWAIESAKMAAVYSNGHLTIAGTKSSSGRGGLFATTPDFRVDGQTPEGEDYTLFFRERIDHHIDSSLDTYGMTSTEKYYPLLTRAWVYQERMLSNRVLHFGQYELFFECKSSIQCECGMIEVQGTTVEEPVPLIKIEYADALSGYAADHKGQELARMRYHGARLWRTMVCCYTALRLTKSKDRLPAFGGLAKQMARERQAKYLAGLWEDTLYDDLLWSVTTTGKLKQPRPEPRNAPTWSWASVECFAGVWYKDAIVFTQLDGGSYEDQVPHTHFCKIEKFKVMTGVNEFGLTADGMLIICGLVAEGVYEREVVTRNGEENVVDYVVFPSTRLPFHSDYLLSHEGPNFVGPGSTLVCLRMSLMQDGSKEVFLSLVLRQSPKSSSCLERIGIMEIRGAIGTVDTQTGIYQAAESREMVII